jgi:hypothetical protein
MTPQDSRQIEYLRVFCILSMMWVHVSPGIATPSIVSGGQLSIVGLVLGDTLGRISVSLLSFVSGYLFWLRARSLPLQTVAWRRFESIVLPSLVWSAIYLVLAASKITFTGLVATVFSRTDSSLMEGINAWAGLTGPTANLSLFFIRDLFISTLILRMLAPAIDRAPHVAIVGALLLGVLGDRLQPLIFRDAILQFVLLGAGTARLGVSLATLSRPSIGLLFGGLFVLAGYGLSQMPDLNWLETPHFPLLFRRMGICLLTLSLTAALIQIRNRSASARLGRATFLAYLLHVPLIGILWVLWEHFVGTEMEPSYLAFYLITPFVALSVGYLLDSLLDSAPPTMQLALRGKVRIQRRPRPH